MAVGGPVDEFELMRRRVKQEGKAAGQQRQQELKRQFARTGQLQSGAFIKQSGIEQQQQQQQQQRALEGVDIAQAGVQRQEREAERGREFARGERIGAQEFAGTQAGLQREFQATQQEAQNTFNALQAQLGREFTTQERLAVQDYAKLAAEDQQEFQKQLADEGYEFQKLITGFDEKTGRTGAEILQREIMKFEQDISKQNNAVNMMNSLLGVGFNRTEVQKIMKDLGIDGVKLNIPGSEPVEPAPTVSAKTTEARRQVGKLNPFNPESIFKF
jgi:hypothetical protein